MVDEAADTKNKVCNQRAVIRLCEVLTEARGVANVELVANGNDYAIFGCTIEGIPSSITWSVTP